MTSNPTSNKEPLPPLDLSQVPSDIREALQRLIDEFSEIFSESPKAGGALVDTLEHTIKLIPGAKPPFRRNHRLSPLEMAELKRQALQPRGGGLSWVTFYLERVTT